MDVVAMASSRCSPRGQPPSNGEVELLGPPYNIARKSFQSEILLLDVDAGDFRLCNDSHKDETFGTQRVYKKTSPNCVLTMYLPSREITLVGSSSSVLRGIVFVDPKAIQGYRVYAQLTLTFRYGREDEEVMGLRFCNEAIMSLHQVWPRNEEPARESLSPLQDALVKRLGDGAHPFTLTLTPHAPPSVQLVPAKRYYGAPIGTSYDVRCFIADKTDEKFHRRASVKMGVRVIYRADLLQTNGLDNLPGVANSSHHQQVASPPSTGCLTTMPPPAHPSTCTSSSSGQQAFMSSSSTQHTVHESAVSNLASSGAGASEPSPTDATSSSGSKSRKSERGESFSKLRLSPKSFRFSSRFGRSKSEIEKCPNDSFYNYSKSFQEYDNLSGGPQGSVDKPFLLQDGRVGLRASLDKAWYTHGEEVCVTVNIRNDSRKTVRKVRVCAIQHVDVCMFNNGKFKNVVADSDSNSPTDRTVSPGGTLNTTIVLKPQRGPTKNWIALEDTLQRSTEPDEITGAIAASAIRSPILLSSVLQAGSSHSSPGSAATHCQQQQLQQSQSYLHHALHLQQGSTQHHHQQHGDDRNVFAIYVSYYVKVKLTLSGIGGELSLKLPFVLVHVDEEQRQQRELMLAQDATHRLALDDVPVAARKHPSAALKSTSVRGETIADNIEENSAEETPPHAAHLDRIESMDDENLNIKLSIPIIKSTATTATTKTHSRMNSSHKRRLIRSETLARDEDDEDAINEVYSSNTPTTTTTTNTTTSNTTCSSTLHSMKSGTEVDTVHFVQIHNALPEQHMEAEAAIHAAEVASQDS